MLKVSTAVSEGRGDVSSVTAALSVGHRHTDWLDELNIPSPPPLLTAVSGLWPAVVTVWREPEIAHSTEWREFTPDSEL